MCSPLVGVEAHPSDACLILQVDHAALVRFASKMLGALTTRSTGVPTSLIVAPGIPGEYRPQSRAVVIRAVGKIGFLDCCVRSTKERECTTGHSRS